MVILSYKKYGTCDSFAFKIVKYNCNGTKLQLVTLSFAVFKYLVVSPSVRSKLKFSVGVRVMSTEDDGAGGEEENNLHNRGGKQF